MTNLEITLSIILSFSFIINVILGIYARAAIVRLLSVAEELYDLSNDPYQFNNLMSETRLSA